MIIKDVDNINIKRLIQGYQYSYLPEKLLLGDMESNLVEIVSKLLKDENKYCYRFNNGLITVEKLNGVSRPDYIYGFGSEPISFYDFKKNGSFREIQIPNLIYYLAFMYNSIVSLENVFNKIYVQDNKFTSYSNSYVVFNNEFTIHNNYDDSEEEIICGEFAPRNNKTVSQLTSEEKAERYLEKMSSKQYVLKLDIESFFPNIYTHFLSSIKDMAPYDMLIDKKEYFIFLDKYYMKVGSNQTKGIMSGCFASSIGAELLMLCVDYEISNYIEELDVGYIRYVDDFTFFSDSKELLINITNYVQKVLNKYKLRINHSKTKISENVIFIDSLDFNTIDHDFCLIKNIWNNYNDFIQLKKLFKNYIVSNKISELKVILSRIAREIKDNKIVFESISLNQNVKHVINYLLQLVFYHSYIAVNCYRILYELLNYYQSHGMDTSELIKYIEKKNIQVNERYSNTLIQIWHYYLLNNFGNIRNIPSYYYSLIDQAKNQNESINPLVLLSFIEKGENKNKEIFNYIIDQYQKECNEKDNWKQTIMLSKWWLPLLKIRCVDNHNYHEFYCSKNFLSIWKDLTQFDDK